MRPERVEKEVGKKLIKKPQVVYISLHRPDNPRCVANLKRCPVCQTPEVINRSNFHRDRPNSLGSTGDRVWGSSIDFPNDSFNEYIGINSTVPWA